MQRYWNCNTLQKFKVEQSFNVPVYIKLITYSTTDSTYFIGTPKLYKTVDSNFNHQSTSYNQSSCPMKDKTSSVY